MSGPPRVVLDANVLFPFALRDLLLRSAEASFFVPRWSPAIIDEVVRNLIRVRGLSHKQTSRLVDAMNGAFPEACVTDYERHVPRMRNDMKDCHVLAAAVESGSSVVVTQNLKDFRWTPPGIIALSPDEFLSQSLTESISTFANILRQQAADLQNPAIAVADLLKVLCSDLPEFVAKVEGYSE